MTREEAIATVINTYGALSGEISSRDDMRQEFVDECLDVLEALGVTDDEIKAAR